MKRIYFLLVLILLSSACCWAQSSGRITYRVFSLNLKPDHSYEAVLDFDAKHSIFAGAPYTGEPKTNALEQEVEGSSERSTIKRRHTRRHGEAYVVTEAEGAVVSYEVLLRRDGLHEYITTEPVREIEWELVDSTRKFANLEAKGAKCSFRGRNYFAWYAPLIPVGFGPWKFNGLPGLILDVHEIDGVFAFRFDGIELDDKHAMPEVIFPKTAERISIKDYALYRDRMGEDMANLIRARSARGAEVNYHTVRTGDEALIEKNFADIFGTQE